MGQVLSEDVTYKESIEPTQIFYCRIYAHFGRGPASLRIELRNVDGHVRCADIIWNWSFDATILLIKYNEYSPFQPLVYVSTKDMYPHAKSCIWKLTEHGARYLTISDGDKGSVSGWYYIAITSDSAATFSLKVIIHSSDRYDVSLFPIISELFSTATRIVLLPMRVLPAAFKHVFVPESERSQRIGTNEKPSRSVWKIIVDSRNNQRR